jgi:hypothetical protein
MDQTGDQLGATPQDGSDGDEDDGDQRSFSEIVDEHQKAHPKMSRSSSIDHCMTTKEGRRAMQVEKRVRLNRALRF